MRLLTAAAIVGSVVMAQPGVAQVSGTVSVEEADDSVSVRLIDADLRQAVQALGRYLDRPIVFGNLGEQYRVTIETPGPVPRSAVIDLLAAALEAHQLILTESPEVYRVESFLPDIGFQTDVGGQVVPRQLFVLRLRHARALDVAGTVNALFGQASALGELGVGAPTLGQSIAADLVPPVDAPPPGQRPVVPQAAELTSEIAVIADEPSNSLLIRASRQDFELISAAVEQLDIRPLQVLIEVVVAEVRTDRSLGIGMETILPETQGSDVSGSIEGLGLGDFILRVIEYGVGGLDLTSTLALAASRGDARILSRPVILAANNETAEIMVGSQRPFIQVQRALPTEAAVRDQVVQFKDVGTRLTVTPTISDDGYVMLQVTQEVNAATAEVAFDAPVISTRSIQTQLLVRDRRTAVLGGLVDQQTETTKRGVPLLMEIPVLGGLFGSQVSRSSETELFIFLTPKVIRSDEELDALTDEVQESRREEGREPGRESGSGSVR